MVKIGGGDGSEAVKKEEDDIVWVLIQAFGAMEIQGTQNMEVQLGYFLENL